MNTREIGTVLSSLYTASTAAWIHNNTMNSVGDNLPELARITEKCLISNIFKGNVDSVYSVCMIGGMLHVIIPEQCRVRAEREIRRLTQPQSGKQMPGKCKRD